MGRIYNSHTKGECPICEGMIYLDRIDYKSVCLIGKKLFIDCPFCRTNLIIELVDVEREFFGGKNGRQNIGET